MSVVITINATGLEAVRMKLNGNVDRSSDLTVPMKQGSALMMGSVAKNFLAGGRPMRWAPLAASTLKYKVMKGLSSTPLTGRTGLLRASIVSEVDISGFKLGTSVPYARIHQKGGFAGRNRASFIPARPYLVFQDSDIEEINQLVVDYITKGE